MAEFRTSDITRFKMRIQMIIEKSFGPKSDVVLTYHMRKQLNIEPYRVLWESPHTYYKCLVNICGETMSLEIFRIIGNELVKDGVINTTDKLLALILKNDDKSRENLLCIWKKAIEV